MTPIYLGSWNCKEDMIADFADVRKPDDNCSYPAGSRAHMRWLNERDKYDEAMKSTAFDVTILLASYETGNWEGEAFVLFEKDGTLYEVNASHCSCYGLENQWSPEETDISALEFRLTNGTFGRSYWGNIFADELSEILEVLKHSISNT